VQRLGIAVRNERDGWRIEGRGLRGLRPANGTLDCGNSGTTLRLLTGVLAAQPFATLLTGDASLLRRPMARVVEPLRRMHATIACLGENERPPLRIEPPAAPGLCGMHHVLEVDSAQVRSALLFAGLYAHGPTSFSPPGVSRDHTERLLRALGVPVQRGAARTLLLPALPRPGWPAFETRVPGDVSAAAFFVAAAAATPGARLRVRGVGINPGRARYLDVLRAAGAAIAVTPRQISLGEPWGDVHVRGGRLAAMRLAGEDVVQCIDEVPALLAGAAVAGCAFELFDAAELRVKESDRIAVMADVLRRFGARVEERREGLRLHAGAALHAARVASCGDHRVAMAATVLAARVPAASRIDGVECVATSYPAFARDVSVLARTGS
jgi:3-phosphoshikimate 1-carboxyvinyltransferase